MTDWKPADSCRVVGHDQVLPATVDYQDEHGFVFADIPELGRAIAFKADTGLAFGSNSGWRLVPDHREEAAPAPGEEKGGG